MFKKNNEPKVRRRNDSQKEYEVIIDGITSDGKILYL